MAQAMLASEHLPEALQTLIVEKAEGNPFFVEEVVKSLLEVDAIQRAKPAGAKGTYLKKISISSTMGAGISVALDSLSA